MANNINRYPMLQKGRLAGFFLCLMLVGCQPASEPSPGLLAYTQAQRALAADLPIKAREHLQLAIQQGHPAAAQQWQALTREQYGPNQQFTMLGAWSGKSFPVALRPALGLWRDGDTSLPLLTGIGQQTPCSIRIQPVLSTMWSIQHWQSFQQDWSQSAMAGLKVCFLPPVLVDSRDLACTEQHNRRIACRPEALVDIVQRGKASLLLVAAGRGQASFNNGWLQLPENFSPALFRHEFSHALGFIDEYALPAAVAATECARTDLLPNILMHRSDVKRYAKYWDLAEQDLTLSPVDTCQTKGQIVWRPVLASSHMQHYELQIPPIYLHIMQRQLLNAGHLMPVQYYFAYLARQQHDMPRWQQMMQLAAGFGYPAAQEALAGAGISLTAR